jgi:hypothetical protein
MKRIYEQTQQYYLDNTLSKWSIFKSYKTNFKRNPKSVGIKNGVKEMLQLIVKANKKVNPQTWK